MFLTKVFRLFERLSDLAFFLGKWILILAMLFIFLGVLIQVFFRYVVNQPLLAPAELTTWCLVWAGYFGVSVVLRTEGHVSLQLVVSKFDGKIRFGIKLLAKCMVLFFVIFFTVYGLEHALTNKAFSWAVNMRVMWAMFGIPLAGSFMFIHMIYLILKDIMVEFNLIKVGDKE